MIFNIYKLGELGELARGKSKHRPRYDPVLYGGNYPFIQTGDIKVANKYITSYETTYNEVGLSQSKLWKSGILCITIAANIAETALLSIEACFPDSVVAFDANPKVTSNEYMYYYFQNFKKQIQNNANGSVQENINLKILNNLEVRVPDIKVQNKIVSMLSLIDSKIELNNQMIATLEELAATLFKRWFVDFEFPDENGNPYKSSGGKMVDSELGEIPEGWSTTALGSQVSFEYGKSLTKSQRNFGTIPVYGSNGIVDYHDKELVSGPGIIIGRKGTVGTVNFSSKDFFPIDTTFWVKILTDTKPINYFYFLLKNLNLDNLTSDSAVPGLNRNTALRTEIVVPTERIINHFERTVETFRYLSDEIEDNIGLLGDVRDSLLPKILSGEIEV